MAIAKKSNWWLYVPLGGLVINNGWLLGTLVNWPNTYHGAFISELEAYGQPLAVLFRSFDIISGIIWLLAAYLIWRQHRRLWPIYLFMGLLTTLGISSIVDALLPLDCSETLNLMCRYSPHFSSVHLWHLYESIVVTIITVSIIIATTVLKQYYHQHDRLFWIGVALIIASVIWASDTLLRNYLHIWGYGYVQRGYELIFDFWFLTYWRELQKTTQHSFTNHY